MKTRSMRTRLYLAAGIALLLLAAPCLVCAQLTQEWVSRYNGPSSSTDIVYDLYVDTSGNSYTCGYSYSTTGSDYAVVKYDTDGNQLWVGRYNNPAYNGSDTSYACTVDSSGNVYLAGYSYGSGTYTDYATVKFDSSGNQVWVARYNGPSNRYDYGYDVAVDGSGNVYVVGYSDQTTSSTSRDMVTIKYDSNGNQVWLQRYNGPGNSYDYGRLIELDPSGDVIAAGYGYGSGTGYDYFAVKYNASTGAQQWVARYNGTANSSDYCYHMTVDSSGNTYLTGASYGSGTSADITTVKLDNNGNQQWVARYDLSGGSDYGYGVDVDSSGNVYVAGYGYYSGRYYDYVTLKYDSSGNQVWVSTYNRANYYDYGRAIAVDSASGNVYVTGESQASSSSTSRDICTILYDKDGNEMAVDCYNGPGSSYDYGRGVKLGPGGVWVNGYGYGSGTSYDYTTIKYLTNRPPVAESGGPYVSECNGLTSTVQLDGQASSDPDSDPLRFAWTTTCPGGAFDDDTSATPLLSLQGPPPCPVACEVNVTVDDGKGATDSSTSDVTVSDTTAPSVLFTLNPVPDDEDPDEDMDGVYSIDFIGEDVCDQNADITGVLDVYGNGATCDALDPAFAGLPLENGMLIRLTPEKKRDKVECITIDDDDMDPTLPVKYEIKGPAVKLTGFGTDACQNSAGSEHIERTLDPKGCISAITLENSAGEQRTFYWYEWTKGKWVFMVGSEYAEIKVDCSKCILPGDQFGTLTVVCVQAGKKLAKKCDYAEDVFEPACP